MRSRTMELQSGDVKKQGRSRTIRDQEKEREEKSRRNIFRTRVWITKRENESWWRKEGDGDKEKRWTKKEMDKKKKIKKKEKKRDTEKKNG